MICPQGMIAQGTQCHCPREELAGRKALCRRRRRIAADLRRWRSLGRRQVRSSRDRRRQTPGRKPATSGRRPVTGAARGETCAALMQAAIATRRERMRVSGKNNMERPDLRAVGRLWEAAGEGRFGGLWRHVAQAAALPGRPGPRCERVCGCPPDLEAVIEAGKALCCLTPCPAGRSARTRCVPDPKVVTLAAACPAGWSGTPPACCAPGTVFQDGRCQRPASATPVPLTPTLTCEGGMVGTPPNCSCPANSQFDGRRWCRSCARRTTGVYPTCCGPDTVYRDGRCVAVTQPPPPLTCTGGRVPVGTPPRCECPDGTRFDARQRRCMTIEQPPPTPTCTGGMVPVGTPPRCECPDGTRFDPRQRRCATIEQPPPSPTCMGGMVLVGTPPRCECPDGTRFDPRQRRCATIEQPPPTLTCTGGCAGRHAPALRMPGRYALRPSTAAVHDDRAAAPDAGLHGRHGAGRHTAEMRMPERYALRSAAAALCA